MQRKGLMRLMNNPFNFKWTCITLHFIMF